MPRERRVGSTRPRPPLISEGHASCCRQPRAGSLFGRPCGQAAGRAPVQSPGRSRTRRPGRSSGPTRPDPLLARELHGHLAARAARGEREASRRVPTPAGPCSSTGARPVTGRTARRRRHATPGAGTVGAGAPRRSPRRAMLRPWPSPPASLGRPANSLPRNPPAPLCWRCIEPLRPSTHGRGPKSRNPSFARWRASMRTSRPESRTSVTFRTARATSSPTSSPSFSRAARMSSSTLGVVCRGSSSPITTSTSHTRMREWSSSPWRSKRSEHRATHCRRSRSYRSARICRPREAGQGGRLQDDRPQGRVRTDHGGPRPASIRPRGEPDFLAPHGPAEGLPLHRGTDREQNRSRGNHRVRSHGGPGRRWCRALLLRPDL